MSQENCMQVEPQAEHTWLHKLVGQWTFEGECVMGPDQPAMKHTGSESVRSVGGLWTLGEGKGAGPDGNEMNSFMTLGYDPAQKRFVGTFIASMMTHLWIYSGALDAAGKVLTLDAEGPDFSGGPGMVKYQDIIEFVSDDHRTLKSRLLGPDGKWQQFMTAHYRRKK
jgi:hypothetical protein